MSTGAPTITDVDCSTGIQTVREMTAEEIDDLNEFDLPLHFCVTPNQLLKF